MVYYKGRTGSIMFDFSVGSLVIISKFQCNTRLSETSSIINISIGCLFHNFKDAHFSSYIVGRI